jgi:CheY-like chemotaxis protein
VATKEQRVRAILIPLLAAEEIALRKVHLGSTGISPDLVLRLKELALIERAGRGWRLTPLGKRRYSKLPSAPLRGRGPYCIDDILNRFIPMAQASGIVKADQIEADSAGGFASSSAHQAPRILVAEDSPLEATELAHLLRDCGYQVVGPVGELSEAMMLASGQPLDGALLDIDLGGELSFGVASTLQRRSVPLAFISGHDPSIVPDAQQLRAIPFVAKPFEDEAVVAMVKTFAP